MLTITTDQQPATDLGYLLHKHPDQMQTFDLPFGQAAGSQRPHPSRETKNAKNLFTISKI